MKQSQLLVAAILRITSTINMEKISIEAITRLRKLGYSYKAMLVGNCATYANMLKLLNPKGKVIAIRQDLPKREYHTVFYFGQKFYDAKDTLGVSSIKDLKFWTHVNKGLLPVTYVTYQPGHEPK